METTAISTLCNATFEMWDFAAQAEFLSRSFGPNNNWDYRYADLYKKVTELQENNTAKNRADVYLSALWLHATDRTCLTIPVWSLVVMRLINTSSDAAYHICNGDITQQLCDDIQIRLDELTHRLKTTGTTRSTS